MRIGNSMSFPAAPADERPELRIGMIGYSFMGAAHSQGWRVAPKFFDLPMNPVMKTIVGRNADAVAQAATQLGWQTYNTDWRAVVESEDRKSTRLNSSHVASSYSVFCLKKKR